MSLAAAAHIGHQVNHTSALAGFVAGAVIGAIVAVGILAVVATGGLAAPAVLAAIGLGVGIGSFVGEQIGKRLIPPTPSGPIITGSPNVFINGKPGAFCSSDVACIKDATQKIAQGSANVGYNKLPAARVGDKGTCGFAVGEGSPNVFVGGEMGGCGLAVGDEVPWYARAIVMAIGLLGGVVGLARAGVCALGIVARLGAGMIVGGVGSYGGGLLGGRLFGEGSFGQDLFSFLGGEALSRLAFRGRLGKWMVGEPIDVVSGDVIVQQTDFRLSAALPLELNRYYSSGLIYDGCHGRKWASSWGQFIACDADYAYFHSDDGRRIPFELPETGEEVRHQFTNKFRLRKTADGFAVKDEENRTRFFETKISDRFLLSAVEDLNKNRIDFTRDETGAIREVNHTGGYRLAVEGTLEQISRVELIAADDSREELVRYEYAASGGLSGVYNQSGLPMRFEYDDKTRLIRWEDRRGTWFAYEYNVEGRCVRTRGINGMYSGSLEYNEQTLTNSYTDSLGNTTHYTYNGEFQVVKIVDPRGGESFYEYDERDNLTASTDALGNRTEFFYDADGNLIKRADALGANFSTRYNNLHQPEDVTDGLGNVFRREYDERGNPLKIIEPNGNFYQYNLDEKGNAAEIVNALGDKCELKFDAKGLVVSATDWKGNKTVMRRDAKGLIREKTDALGQKTLYEYTAIDRLAKVTQPTGATLLWEYDAEGNLLRYTDGSRKIFRYEYGVFNLLIGEFFPDNSRRRYRYDSEARLSIIENERSESYRFAHNENGQITAEQDFAGRILHYEYDLAGRCAKRINGAGQILTFQNDALGRVARQINAAGEETVYEYDANGSLVKAVSADGVETVFEHNEFGRIKTESQNGETVQTTFDALGRRASRRTQRGNEIKWQYDANGLPLEMQFATGEELFFEYDAASRETSRRLASGLKLQKEYDALNRLTHQWAELDANGEFARLAARLSEQKYFYDESGNPLSVQDERRGETDFEYDALGRITRVRRNKREIESYQYDATGNVTQAMTMLGEVRDAAWQGIREISVGGRLRRAGRIEYDYDADGRVVEKRVVSAKKIERWRYEWTSEGRLRGIVNPQGERWRYRYDAFGRRVEKIGEKNSTKYVWDGAVIVEEISDDGATKHWTYEENTFRPLAKIENGKVFAAVNDVSGKPLELFNQTGETAWRQQTNLWSANISEQPSETNCDLRFQGQWFDEESGLHYNFHRYYDPQTARYISNDPIGIEGGYNTYSYVPNPLFWSDPYGLYDGVDFTGSPDLFPTKPGQSNIVTIKLQGSRGRDFTQAYNAAGIKRSEAGGYTWHHAHDFDPTTGESTMQLVRRTAHEATYPHKGSAGQFADHFGVKYDTPESIEAARRQGWHGCS